MHNGTRRREYPWPTGSFSANQAGRPSSPDGQRRLLAWKVATVDKVDTGGGPRQPRVLKGAREGVVEERDEPRPIGRNLKIRRDRFRHQNDRSRAGRTLKRQPPPPSLSGSSLRSSPLRRRIGREAIQAATSDSIQAVRPPMSRPRGNVPARIQLHTVT